MIQEQYMQTKSHSWLTKIRFNAGLWITQASSMDIRATRIIKLEVARLSAAESGDI